jgi:hypothetical protein
MLFHPAGENTSDDDLIITFYFHGPATQYPGNDALQLDQIVSTQWPSFKIKTVIVDLTQSVNSKKKLDFWSLVFILGLSGLGKNQPWRSGNLDSVLSASTTQPTILCHLIRPMSTRRKIILSLV